MGRVMGGGGKPPDGTQSLSSVMTAYGCFSRECSHDGNQRWLMLKYCLPTQNCTTSCSPHIPSLRAINNPGTESLSMLSSITVPHTSIPRIYSQRQSNRLCQQEKWCRRILISWCPLFCGPCGRFRWGYFKEPPVCVCVCVCSWRGCIWTCLSEGGTEGERNTESELSVAAL